MPNIADAMEAYLQAQLRVEEWRTEFLASYYKPALDVMVGISIDQARKSPNVDQSKLMSALSPEAQKFLRGE